jgi:two-component system response regulator YesN
LIAGKTDFRPNEPVFLVCGKAKEIGTQRMQSMQSIIDIIYGLMRDSLTFAYYNEDDCILSLLFQKPTEINELSYEKYKEIIKGDLESVQNTCKEKLNREISFVTSNHFMYLQSIHDEYKSITQALYSILKDPSLNDLMILMSVDEYIQNAPDSYNTQLIISRINKFIEDNVSRDLSLTKIARAVYFNASYLSRFYKQNTGINILEYISELKVEKAKELLANPDLKINKISAQTGFDSPSYFTAFFRKYAGQSPKQYRDSLCIK